MNLIFAPVQLSIIIVSYNVKYFLEQCLHSVQAASGGLSVEIIVVDNASGDGSMAYLKPLFPHVVFIQLPTNVGFAKACNIGLQRATGNHILFLNPDTLLAEETLKQCLQFFAQNKGTGTVGVRMIDGTGAFLKESKRAFPSPLTSLYKLIGLAKALPRFRVFSKYYLGHLPEKEAAEVPVLAGAFMMLPRATLKETGSFDEAFFMYGEDIDLSYRIQQAGYRNYYLGNTTIIHFKGESTERGSLRYVQQFYKAMHIFVRKHYSGSGAALFRTLLQSAIAVRGTLSAIGKGVPKQNGPTTQSNIPIAICSGDETYKFVSAALQQKDGRPTHLHNVEATNQLDQGKVVLCTDVCSYSQMIAVIQQSHKHLRFRFHAVGSKSIVGSDSSTGNGESFALKEADGF